MPPARMRTANRPRHVDVTGYGAGMNFGVRLPGPFRAGVSSSGRVNAGVTVGPLSASTNLGGGRPARAGEVVAPVHILDALADLIDAGWKVKGRGEDWAIVGKGMTALRLDVVHGGTAARRITSTASVVVWLAVAVAIAAVCWGLTVPS